jgi:hypothetical protein
MSCFTSSDTHTEFDTINELIKPIIDMFKIVNDVPLSDLSSARRYCTGVDVSGVLIGGLKVAEGFTDEEIMVQVGGIEERFE